MTMLSRKKASAVKAVKAESQTSVTAKHKLEDLHSSWQSLAEPPSMQLSGALWSPMEMALGVEAGQLEGQAAGPLANARVVGGMKGAFRATLQPNSFCGSNPFWAKTFSQAQTCVTFPRERVSVGGWTQQGCETF